MEFLFEIPDFVRIGLKSRPNISQRVVRFVFMIEPNLFGDFVQTETNLVTSLRYLWLKNHYTSWLLNQWLE